MRTGPRGKVITSGAVRTVNGWPASTPAGADRRAEKAPLLDGHRQHRRCVAELAVADTDRTANLVGDLDTVVLTLRTGRLPPLGFAVLLKFFEIEGAVPA